MKEICNQNNKVTIVILRLKADLAKIDYRVIKSF